MIWSKRILIPIIIALIVSGSIAITFLREIQRSITLIEQSVSTSKKEQPSFLRTIRKRELYEQLKGVQSEVKKTIEQAIAKESEGKLGEAIQLYKDAEAIHQNDGTMALLLHALRKKGNIKDAREMLDKTGSKKNDIFAKEQCLSMYAAEGMNALDTCIVAIEKKEHGTINALRGIAQILKGNHAEALSLFEGVQREAIWGEMATSITNAYHEFMLFDHGEEAHRLTLLARAFAEHDECPIAVELTTKARTQKSQYRDAWIIEGYCLLMMEKPKEALNSLEQAYGIDPVKPETQYFLAKAYQALNDEKNALTFFEYALLNNIEPKQEIERIIIRLSIALSLDSHAIAPLSSLMKTGLLIEEDVKMVEIIASRNPTIAKELLSNTRSLAENTSVSTPILEAMLILARNTGDTTLEQTMIQMIRMVDPNHSLLETTP